MSGLSGARSILYATVGTNPSAIASVLASLHEALGYDEALLLATSISRRYAEEAVKLVGRVFGPSLASRIRILCDGKGCLMDGAGSDPSGVVIRLSGDMKRVVLGGDALLVDVTGGTKLMSSLASIAALLATPRGSSSAQRVGEVMLSYVSSEGVDRLPGWWAGGYYPRIPRRLAKPIVYSLNRGVRRGVEPRPEALPLPPELPQLRYRAGRGLDPLREAVGIVQQLFNAVASSRVRVYIEACCEKRSDRVEVAEVGGLGYEGGVELRVYTGALGELFRCMGLASERGDGRLVGLDAGQLAAVIGAKTLTVESVSECSLAQRNERLIDVVERCTVGGERGECSVWMDTSLAYRGVHNDVYELGYRLVFSGVKNVAAKAVFPRCALREALTRYAENVKSVRAGKLDARYGAAVLDAVAAMAAEELGVGEGGGPGTCDAEMLMVARERLARGKVILATSDRGAYELWKDSGLCAVLVDTKLDYHAEEGDSPKAKASRLRVLAAAAQLVALLSQLAVGCVRLVVEGDARRVIVENGRVRAAE